VRCVRRSRPLALGEVRERCVNAGEGGAGVDERGVALATGQRRPGSAGLDRVGQVRDALGGALARRPQRLPAVGDVLDRGGSVQLAVADGAVPRGGGRRQDGCEVAPWVWWMVARPWLGATGGGSLWARATSAATTRLLTLVGFTWPPGSALSLASGVWYAVGARSRDPIVTAGFRRTIAATLSAISLGGCIYSTGPIFSAEEV